MATGSGATHHPPAFSPLSGLLKAYSGPLYRQAGACLMEASRGLKQARRSTPGSSAISQKAICPAGEGGLGAYGETADKG